MGNEYAPTVLVDLGRAAAKILPSGRFLGVVGDASHHYGYHRSRAWIKANGIRNDYSVMLAADKVGDADAASAVDVGYDRSGMATVTNRLMQAAKHNDPRLYGLREFFGTIDGKTVTGWDLALDKWSTADDSHITHVHLSILRKYANDAKAAAGILAVMSGQPREDIMPTAKEIGDAVAVALMRIDNQIPAVTGPDGNSDQATNKYWTYKYVLGDGARNSRAQTRLLADLVTAVTAQGEQMATIAAAITEIRDIVVANNSGAGGAEPT